ncbi:hypothetical protein ENBRE01_0568 [Enteropsectra breve]|nr:hypothetical protein ENBRE01_0568 [Enteropsectra breve]
MQQNNRFIKLEKKKEEKKESKFSANDYGRKSYEEYIAKKNAPSEPKAENKKIKNNDGSSSAKKPSSSKATKTGDNKHNTKSSVNKEESSKKVECTNKKFDNGKKTDKKSSHINKNTSAKNNKDINHKQDKKEVDKKYKKEADKTFSKEDMLDKKPLKYDRSSKFTYNLVDAKNDERELILHGTSNDKLTCLTLFCARNPSSENYKQLIHFADNKRNDVLYDVIKALRDLVKEQIPEDYYIQTKIVKTMEVGLKNQYIKEKVLDVVAVLIRAEVFPEELISILVERFIEKGDVLEKVQNTVKGIFRLYEEDIIKNIEDFYYKNDNFRAQNAMLKFVSDLEPVNRQLLVNFFNLALTSLSVASYPEEQKDIMMNTIVNGLSASVVGCDSVHIDQIEMIRNYLKSAKSAVSCLTLLHRVNDPYLPAYILKIVKCHILVNTPYESQFLNILYEMKNSSDIITKVLNNSFYFSVQYVISLLIIANIRSIDPSGLYGLFILNRHYHPLVRDFSLRMMHGKKLDVFDPYDKIMMESKTKKASEEQ